MSRFQPYRKRKPYLLTIFLVLLAVIFSFYALRGLLGARSLVQTSIYPFQALVLTAWNTVTGIPSALVDFGGQAKKIAALKTDVSGLKSRLLVLDGLRRENQRLRTALTFRQKNPFGFNLLLAEVVGKSPTPWFSILEINKGSGAGVKKDMPVITSAGLAGQVVEVSRFTAKVLLLIDPASSVAAVNSRSRDFGVVSGSPTNKMSMRFVGAGADIRPGDKIMTSPISTIFPAEVPIGTVLKATKAEHDLFYHIDIQPAVDFSKIEKVFIVF